MPYLHSVSSQRIITRQACLKFITASRAATKLAATNIRQLTVTFLESPEFCVGECTKTFVTSQPLKFSKLLWKLKFSFNLLCSGLKGESIASAREKKLAAGRKRGRPPIFLAPFKQTLLNLGNTCFQNSVFCLMSTIPPMRQIFQAMHESWNGCMNFGTCHK